MYFPVIMLHYVLDDPHESIAKWSITPRKFVEMLDCIDKMHLEVTTFEEIVTRGLSDRQLRNKVVITFDDCPKSLFDFAIPELLKRGMKAVFYVPTAYIGEYNLWDVEEHGTIKTPIMDVSEIKTLMDLGMEIGSHSHHHVLLSKISGENGFDEISQSKKILERILSKPVYSIAYPYGEIPKRFKSSLKKAGYKFGLSIYSPSQHEFSLRRIGIYQTDSKKSILFKLSKSYHLLREIGSPIKKIKRLVTTKGQ